MKSGTPLRFSWIYVVTTLLVIGVAVSVLSALFPDLLGNPQTSTIERILYGVMNVISLSVIWKLVQNQGDMIHHHLELSSMLRKAKHNKKDIKLPK